MATPLQKPTTDLMQAEDRLHIVFVLPDFPLSGAATRTTILAEQLVREGHQVFMISLLPKIDCLLEAKFRELGIKSMVLSRVANVTDLKAFIAGAEKIVVHAATPTAGLCGLALASFLRCPLVYSYTNCLHRHRSFKSRSVWDRLKQALEFLIGRHANALHAVSPSIGRQLSASYPLTQPRIHTIPYFATQPISDVNRTASQKLDDYANAWPRLVCMGRLVSHKRFADVIRAVAILHREWPRIKVVIVGNGPESGKLRQLITKLELETSVPLCGNHQGLRLHSSDCADLFASSLHFMKGYPTSVPPKPPWFGLALGSP